MDDRSITKDDHGEMNARLIAREAKADFRRVESASRKLPVLLYSPEGKRLYIRFFNTTQLNTHFISVIAPLSLPAEDIGKAEEKLYELVASHTEKLNSAIAEADEICRRNGIASLATYDVEVLSLEAKVISKLGRRYLELIEKVDQLMPMLETLVIDEVMAKHDMNLRKTRAKRGVREISSTARAVRAGLQKRIRAASPTPTLAPSEAPDEAAMLPLQPDTLVDELFAGASMPTREADNDVGTTVVAAQMNTVEMEVRPDPNDGAGGGEDPCTNHADIP
ncbi:DUF1845 domain-containing protein [Duganella sp. FT92W]|uniref:DUF1845 domain-containing protein n=1 Tax=Pseudoduganella rivuli TaxID=2666085 RepID=A0A7X2IIB2_9BURK|nr:DUF1845 domain-containing protein [Pseudoduganella rivuli]MRV70557.1 DUF1845 domain-containing protein [Pseudoduganella rivuli]